jgi:NADH:ubiquinone reductase (H+-translocating)
MATASYSWSNDPVAGHGPPALRSVVRKQANARVVLADVRHLDLQGRLVRALAPDGQQLTLPYDTLVVAAG